jgi:hypothetical protein
VDTVLELEEEDKIEHEIVKGEISSRIIKTLGVHKSFGSVSGGRNLTGYKSPPAFDEEKLKHYQKIKQEKSMHLRVPGQLDSSISNSKTMKKGFTNVRASVVEQTLNFEMP